MIVYLTYIITIWSDYLDITNQVKSAMTGIEGLHRGKPKTWIENTLPKDKKLNYLSCQFLGITVCPPNIIKDADIVWSIIKQPHG